MRTIVFKIHHHFCLFLVLLMATGAAVAHLPSYEAERVRNDNHFTTEGFAWPVRGECDINAFGPTDPNAGSANIYLGPDNTPPNFFCAFTTQDDWSFEYPVDIIEATRTPAPDPTTIGQPLQEGYIPCSPPNRDHPFLCRVSVSILASLATHPHPHYRMVSSTVRCCLVRRDRARAPCCSVR